MLEVYGQQATLTAKVIADGRVVEGEAPTIAAAMARLAGFYGFLRSLQAEPTAEEHIGRLRRSVEARSLALDFGARGDRAQAEEKLEEAERLLEEPAAEHAVNAGTIRTAAETVYDRSTGRSRYDADGWLSFRIRCPHSTCRNEHFYRLMPRHPTHRLSCSSCRKGFLVFAALVRAANVERRNGLALHRAKVRGADGMDVDISFPASADGKGTANIVRGDLLLFVYDSTSRLRTVRNYTRGDEVVIQNGDPCFVATAATGPDAPEVVVLRGFRDETLVHYGIGRALVACYGHVGPPLARFIARGKLRRAAAATLVRIAARLASSLQRPRP